MRQRIASLLTAVLSLFGGAVALAPPAGATDVNDAASLGSAFGTPTETYIRLTSDITVQCADTPPTRTSTTPITVDGQGQFTITMACAGDAGFEILGDLDLVGLRLVGAESGVIIEGDLTMTDTTLTGFTSTLDAFGVIAAGDVTMTRSSINTVSGGEGAVGIINAGDVVLQQSSITGLAAGEAALGVFTAGSVSLTDSLLSGYTGDFAYGIFNGGEALSIVRSTLTGIAGAVDTFTLLSANTSAVFVNSTFTNNAGPIVLETEGAAFVYSDVLELGTVLATTSLDVVPELPEGAPEGLKVLRTSLPAGTEPGALQTGGQIISDGPVSFFGTVVALPQDGGVNCDVVPPPTSNGYNFSDDDTCGFTSAGDRQNAGDPMLGALGDNGGPTPTRLPLAGSPLLDSIPLAACQSDGASGVTNDQRLLARPSGSGCDVGSVEVQLVVLFTG